MRFRGRWVALGGSVLLCAAAGVRAELAISGVDDEIEDVVRGFVTLDDLQCDSPRWWVNRSYADLEAEARLALETQGYYHAAIAPKLEFEEECWKASLEIRRGESIKFGAVNVSVDGPLGNEPAMKKLLADPVLREGRRFTHARYDAAKSRLLDVAEDLGYFDAKYTLAQVQVDPDAKRADVALTLAGGVRYRIGEIQIEQHELRPELFNRLLRIERGEPFAAKDLADSYRELLGSQYFDRVLVTPDIEGRADGKVPVHVTAMATSRRSILLGAGYATDSGPRGRADLHYRRLNDRGHRASFTSIVSGIEGQVRSEYRIPYGDISREYYFGTAAISYEETDSYLTRLWTAGVGRTHRRGDDWLETNYLNYQDDDFDVGGEKGHSQLLLIGTNWTRKTLIEDPRPTHGYSLSLDVRGATRYLLSDNDLIQTIGTARYILPVSDRVRLLSRASAGWTWQQDFSELPPSIRFFAGGDNSVRGYDYESIGPERNGEVLGGERMLTGSLELDVKVREQWSVALFTDAGSAFDESPEFMRSVGLGVRWYSPLGPLRLDLAHPLDDVERSFRIHVSLGPDL
jgi:translocation and assembly module TamA